MTTATISELSSIIFDVQFYAEMANGALNHYCHSKQKRADNAIEHLHNIQRILNANLPPEADCTGHDWTAEIAY